MSASRDGKEIAGLLFSRFHDPRYIHPDPLEIVREYPDPLEREVAALVCAAFALGNVKAIISFERDLLRRLGSPRNACMGMDPHELTRLLASVRYRFYRTEEIAALLAGIGSVLREYGSLNAAFLRFLVPDAADTREALRSFVRLVRAGGGGGECVLPDPEKDSACKRLHLFLKWVVRSDSIDPGGWKGVSTRQLLIPVDTHILRVSRILGYTKRKTADIRTSLEITAALREIDPEDPVKFDFSLTRPGIHPCLSYECLDEWRKRTA